MKKIVNYLRKNRLFVLFGIFLIALVFCITIPTFARYKNRTSIYSSSSWNGSVATSYRSGDGTSGNPYVISNGSELAYFALQLSSTNYEDTYFVLDNDIILNSGIFSYSDLGIEYTKDNVTSSINLDDENSIINKFNSLDGFKGNFDGNFHSIYGLFISNDDDIYNGLFTNLEGSVSNLYVENSIIYGGMVVGGIVSNASNSYIKNVLYNGYVISNDSFSDNKEFIIGDKSYLVSDNVLNDSIDINGLSSIIGNVTKINLTGIYENSDSEGILKINGNIISDSEFSLDLGSNLINSISLDYESSNEGSFTLSNLKLTVSYTYGNAAGIVSLADNTSILNVINKSDIYGEVYASGIVNVLSGESIIKNSYNNGLINGNYLSSGIVSSINYNSGEVNIVNCYNIGDINSYGGFIGNIESNSGEININNSFNVTDNYMINMVNDSVVNVSNTYVLFDNGVNDGSINGEFILTSDSNLKNKEFISDTLGYKEFNNASEIIDDVWIFDGYPILYFDDINNPICNIHIGSYLWNNYGYELNTLKFDSSFSFSIEESDELSPLSNIYYYISNSKDVISKDELDLILDWTEYNGIVNIDEEGFYVIYVKVTNYNGDVSYLNTDLLVLDLTGSSISISSSYLGKNWDSLSTDLDSYYVSKYIDISISAVDSLSGVSGIYYYVSDKALSSDDLDDIESWTSYNDSFTLDSSDKAILYVKVIDNCNYVTYANSDYIILEGYSFDSLSAGLSNEFSSDLYITDKSSVLLGFSYNGNNSYDLYSHEIVSNVSLPVNSNITLIDKVNDKVYKYVVNGDDYKVCNNDLCEYIYDFTLFDEVGSMVKFSEDNYSGEINENFAVLIDFSNCLITDNISDIIISLRLKGENSNIDTLVSSLKKFSIITDSNASFTFTSSFDDTINYSDNNKYLVGIESKLNYMYIDDNKVFDTSYDDKIVGLALYITDSNGNIIDSKYLRNMIFTYDNKKFYPSSDGIVRVNINNGINDIMDNLSIETFKDNSLLACGNYKLVISLYLAYDGVNYSSVIDSLVIPLYVGVNNVNSDNSFDIVMDSDDRIVSSLINEFNFRFMLGNGLNNPNVRVYLYKKNLFTAFDQGYTQMDISNYLSNYDMSYYVINNINNNSNYSIELNTSSLENNGYMFVFELYDGDRFVSKVSKKFIVKQEVFSI